MSISVSGRVDKFIFVNNNSNFKIFRIKGCKYPIKGCTPASIGHFVKIFGNKITHPTYGEQIDIISCEISMPKDEHGLMMFLVTNIKGIGEIKAQKLINKFGMKLIGILDKTPEKISEACPINQKAIDLIAKEWKTCRNKLAAETFLMKHGIRGGLVKKLVEMYGSNVVNVITENPYVIMGLPGVGFVTADAIAMSVGIKPGSLMRVKAIVVEVLNDSVRGGHTYMILDDFVVTMMNEWSIRDDKIVEALQELVSENDVIEIDDKTIYLIKYKLIEQSIASNVLMRI